MKLIVYAQVNPTENREKVLKALENVFPSLEFKGTTSLEASGNNKNDLLVFKEHLKLQLIRDTAKVFLTKRMEGQNLSFDLNKQAAFARKVNFIDFNVALGTINVKIEEKNMAELIDWLTSESA